MGSNRAGTDLLTGICILILWNAAGISWIWLVMLFVLAMVVNNIEYILRAQRAMERVRRNLMADLSEEMEAARKREMARIRRKIEEDDDDTRTVN